MMRAVVLWVLGALILCGSLTPAQAYVFDNKSLIYHGANSAGYRAAPRTSADLPLSDITVYPESETPARFAVSYEEERSLATHGTAATFLVHTRFSLNP